MAENEKTNLTLRLSKEVVDKARELSINLSAITESMLKTENLSKDQGLITPNKIRDAYRKVFLLLIDILQEWDIYLKIGKERENVVFTDSKGKKSFYPMDYSYYLSPKGKIELCEDEDPENQKEWEFNEDWPINELFEPDKLIENLINRLYSQAERNREKIQKLSLLKNVLEKIKPEKKDEKSEKET